MMLGFEAEHTVFSDRMRWPYPALLPHSIKAYPIVQLATPIGPQDPRHWPLPMDRKLQAWNCDTARFGSAGNLIYVHIPFCPFLCHFCPLYKVNSYRDRSADTRERLVRCLIKEIQLMASASAARGKAFNTLYFGGGTPTELTPAQLGRILSALRSNFDITPDAEITLEGVARQMLAPEYLEACLSQGYNRISFGVQSLDLRLRQRIGRGDSIDDYPALIERVRKIRPNLPINLEIMAGLPEQTLQSFRRDLLQVAEWQPDSLDILYYVMMPGTRLYDLVKAERRTAPSYGSEMLRKRMLANSFLSAAGYKQITGEVFVRRDRDLFVQSSFGGGGNALNTVLALGPSAFGFINGSVYHNICDIHVYMKSVDSGLLPLNTADSLTLKSAQRRAMLFAILQLRVPGFLLDDGRYGRVIRKWQRLGLVTPTASGYEASALGQL